MANARCWAKIGAYFLAEGSVLVFDNSIAALAECAAIATRFCSPLAAQIGLAGDSLESLAASLGKRCGDDRRAIDYLHRSGAITKSHETSLDAASFHHQLEASHAISSMGSELAGIEQALRELQKKCKADKGAHATEKERLALEIGLSTVASFGKRLGSISSTAVLTHMSESDRFSPQKGYAAFLPAHQGVPEGFWGSNNRGGMDLGSAKLFESPERAKSYFDRGGFGSFTLVEVEMKIRAIIPTGDGPESIGDGLASALAHNERAEIEELLASGAIEALRARLAQLEAATSMKPSPSKSSRL